MSSRTKYLFISAAAIVVVVWLALWVIVVTGH
jgi:hypothetical protein